MISLSLGLTGCGKTGGFITKLKNSVPKTEFSSAPAVTDLAPVADGGVAFEILALAGVAIVIIGVIGVFISKVISSRMVLSTSIMAALFGLVMMITGYALPRWSWILENFLAENMLTVILLGLGLSATALAVFLTREWTYYSAYWLGFKDGEDGSPRISTRFKFFK